MGRKTKVELGNSQQRSVAFGAAINIIVAQRVDDW
jgi:hypothetical protein